MKLFKAICLGVLISFVAVSCKETAQKSKENIEVNAGKQALKSIELDIEGMTCQIGCAKTIESKLSKLEGVTAVAVSFEDKLGKITYDASKVSEEKIKSTITTLGDGKTYTVTGVKQVAAKKCEKDCKAKCGADCTKKDCGKCAAKKDSCKGKCEAKKACCAADLKACTMKCTASCTKTACDKCATTQAKCIEKCKAEKQTCCKTAKKECKHKCESKEACAHKCEAKTACCSADLKSCTMKCDVACTAKDCAKCATTKAKCIEKCKVEKQDCCKTKAA